MHGADDCAFTIVQNVDATTQNGRKYIARHFGKVKRFPWESMLGQISPTMGTFLSYYLQN